MDEYYGIYDPIIYGGLIFELRFSCEDKATMKIKTTNNEIILINSITAPWVVGLGHIMLHEFFTWPKFIMVCAHNYDDKKKSNC